MATYACIASFHTNPYTCGVARFNGALATELGSKVLSLVSAASLDSGTILLSIKLEEIDDAGKLQLETIVNNSSFVLDLFFARNR